ncbi:MAG TPA: hypothetical protein VG963_31255, partial [Polyangiaceae bacterium]|nr:hypothetical protein [Polyangiaceae bacterium]
MQEPSAWHAMGAPAFLLPHAQACSRRELLGRGGRAVLLLWTAASCAHSCSWAKAAPPALWTGPADAIVVLGHRPPLAHGELEYETRARVEHGVALYRAG